MVKQATNPTSDTIMNDLTLSTWVSKGAHCITSDKCLSNL